MQLTYVFTEKLISLSARTACVEMFCCCAEWHVNQNLQKYTFYNVYLYLFCICVDFWWFYHFWLIQCTVVNYSTKFILNFWCVLRIDQCFISLQFVFLLSVSWSHCVLSGIKVLLVHSNVTRLISSFKASHNAKF